jgi:hypothetical protein
MWIFTKEGFISAVSNREGTGLVVRARDKKALDALAESAEVSIAKSPKGDYPYRLFVSKDDFAVWVTSVISDLDYINFKSKVARTRGPEYSEALHDVWATMLHVEDSDARSGLRFGYIQRAQEADRGLNNE